MSEQSGPSAALKEAMAAAYRKGMKDGIAAFAWWKDGTQYVGTCGMTLSEALQEVDRMGASLVRRDAEKE